MDARRDTRRREVRFTVDEAAAELGNDITVRFVRRLITERRIRFVKLGRHVRIPESAISEYIKANTVDPATPRGTTRRAA